MTDREMGIEEARKQLGDLVLDAQRDSIATRITRKGKPAAILMPDATAGDADPAYTKGREDGEAHVAVEERLLAAAIQNHVPKQPDSRYGHRPVPVEIFFDNDSPSGTPEWTVKFVLRLSGRGRQWRGARGATLIEALQAARRMQERGY